MVSPVLISIYREAMSADQLYFVSIMRNFTLILSLCSLQNVGKFTNWYKGYTYMAITLAGPTETMNARFHFIN